jgi:hypothetical protein
MQLWLAAEVGNKINWDNLLAAHSTYVYTHLCHAVRALLRSTTNGVVVPVQPTKGNNYSGHPMSSIPAVRANSELGNMYRRLPAITLLALEAETVFYWSC